MCRKELPTDNWFERGKLAEKIAEINLSNSRPIVYLSIQEEEEDLDITIIQVRWE